MVAHNVAEYYFSLSRSHCIAACLPASRTYPPCAPTRRVSPKQLALSIRSCAFDMAVFRRRVAHSQPLDTPNNGRSQEFAGKEAPEGRDLTVLCAALA